jgi:hypothetical protein
MEMAAKSNKSVTSKKRRSPISRSLVNNSKSAILSAIEIHNKPIFSYRYEVCVLLVINAWELLLKSYIHKFMKHVRLFRKDGTTKPFDECLACVASELGKDFAASRESISLLYEYRNKIAHFYTEDIDIVIFSLLKPNILFYSSFLIKYFDIDLARESELVLLPIGFSKLYSPIDFISNDSLISDSPSVLKDFIYNILKSTKRLDAEGIEEPIIVDYKISLINEKRVKNADIIAGINNQISNSPVFTVGAAPTYVKLIDDPTAQPVRFTHDKEGTRGILLREELSNTLFDEINNVVDANMLLAKGENIFAFDEDIYNKIYAEREHVTNSDERFLVLARAGLSQFYSPFLYWISHLPSEVVAEIIFESMEHVRYHAVRNVIKLTTLLGKNINEWLFVCLKALWDTNPQPPDYYWNLKKNS